MKLYKSYKMHTGRKTFLECASLGTCGYQGGRFDEENWDLWFVLTMLNPEKNLISLVDRLNTLFKSSITDDPFVKILVITKRFEKVATC